MWCFPLRLSLCQPGPLSLCAPEMSPLLSVLYRRSLNYKKSLTESWIGSPSIVPLLITYTVGQHSNKWNSTIVAKFIQKKGFLWVNVCAANALKPKKLLFWEATNAHAPNNGDIWLVSIRKMNRCEERCMYIKYCPNGHFAFGCLLIVSALQSVL